MTKFFPNNFRKKINVAKSYVLDLSPTIIGN